MKKREIDIFGVLLGILIGCIIGYFLSTRINIEIPNNDEQTSGKNNNIYLLQVDKVATSLEASAILTDLESRDIFTVAVYNNKYYYIYGGISDSGEKLEPLKTQIDTLGYSSIVKSEYILDKPNSVIEIADEFDFYTECIQNLIKSIKGETLVISEDTTKNLSINTSLYASITALSYSSNEKLCNKYRLQAYEIIVETLG